MAVENIASNSRKEIAQHCISMLRQVLLSGLIARDAPLKPQVGVILNLSLFKVLVLLFVQSLR